MFKMNTLAKSLTAMGLALSISTSAQAATHYEQLAD